MSSSQLQRLLDGFVAQGCTWRETTAGFFIYCPSGATFSFHKTESDHRALRNTIARAKRAGLTWPLDGKK
jgi:hypothetical protein